MHNLVKDRLSILFLFATSFINRSSEEVPPSELPVVDKSPPRMAEEIITEVLPGGGEQTNAASSTAVVVVTGYSDDESLWVESSPSSFFSSSTSWDQLDSPRSTNGAETYTLGLVNASKIVDTYRNLKLNKKLLAIGAPMFPALLVLYQYHNKVVITLVLIFLIVGYMSVLIALIYMDTSPTLFNVLEQLGFVIFLGAIVGLISSYFPHSVIWIPWLCWALMLPIPALAVFV